MHAGNGFSKYCFLCTKTTYLQRMKSRLLRARLLCSAKARRTSPAKILINSARVAYKTDIVQPRLLQPPSKLKDAILSLEIPSRCQKGGNHANRMAHRVGVNCNSRLVDSSPIEGASRCGHLRPDRSTGFARLRAADLSWGWLHLDARLLGLR